MQKEILSILEGAVIDRGSLADELAKLRARTGAAMSSEEITAAIDEGRP